MKTTTKTKNKQKKKKALLGAALAGLLGLAVATTAQATDSKKIAEAHGKKGKEIKCEGGNMCKGSGKCGGKSHDCAGKNECKGQGWVYATSKKECKSMKIEVKNKTKT